MDDTLYSLKAFPASLLLITLLSPPIHGAPSFWDSCKKAVRSLLVRPEKRKETPIHTLPETPNESAPIAVDPEPFKVIHRETTQYSARQLADTEAVIHQINDMVTGHLQIPDKILVELTKDEGGHFKHKFQGDVGYIDSPYQHIKRVQRGAKTSVLKKHPVYSRTILAHEYGHALFYETLRKRQESFAQAMNRWPSYWDFDSPSTAPLYDLTLPYNEFFADLVAVLYAKDPAAIRKSLSFTGMSPKQKKEFLLRDFSARNIDTIPIPKNRRGAPIPHTLLGPTRSYLGNKILKNPLYRNQPGLVAAKVLNAIALEIESGYTQTQVTQLSIKEMNDRLIERIAREFE